MVFRPMTQCLSLGHLGVPELLEDIIRSFHDDMDANIVLDQTILKENTAFIKDVQRYLL